MECYLNRIMKNLKENLKRNLKNNNINYQKMKKSLILLVCLLGCFLNSKADIYSCFNLNGIWGKWDREILLYGSGSVSKAYLYLSQPYEFVFHWTIDNYIKPSKQLKNQTKKEGKWLQYTGWVEYYVTEQYPTIESLIKSGKIDYWPNESTKGAVKRRASAIIKINPDYKSAPTVYNIWFDGVGVGINFRERSSWW